MPLLLEEFIHLRIIHRLTEGLVDAVVFLEHFHGFRCALLDDLANRRFRIKLRFLLEVAQREPGRKDALAVELRVRSCEDVE